MVRPTAHAMQPVVEPVQAQMMVGYPNVVVRSGPTRYGDLACDKFSAKEREWLGSAQAEFLGRLETETSLHDRIRFVDVRAAFFGHEACVPNQADEWLNAVILRSSSGSSGVCPLLPSPK